MSRQYKRKYELTIIPADGEARVIRDLNCNFEIIKTVRSIPNSARITIINPNIETVGALKRRYTNIIFNAGYEGNLQLIFKGQVKNSFESKNNLDRSITVFAGDGQRDWENATTNRTYAENVTIQNVVKDVLKSFKEVTIGTLEGLPNLADKIRGQTLSGKSSDILDSLAKEYGFKWGISDNEVKIEPVIKPLNPNQAVLINAAHGMIGSPSVTEIGADVTVLLNPALLPGELFKVEATSANVELGNLFFREAKKTSADGIYRIEEVVFTGDLTTGSPNWRSKVKGVTV